MNQQLWYRQPMVWMLLGIPGSAVIMGAVMLTLAITSYDGLVADDYYRLGLQINRSLARDDSARVQGLSAVVYPFEPGLGEEDRSGDGLSEKGLVLDLSSHMDVARLPAIVQLNAYRTTRSDADRTIMFYREAGGTYRAPNVGLPMEGVWNVELTGANWRLRGRFTASGDPSATLSFTSHRRR